MLYEIVCDKFKTKKVLFNSGLNTVLGTNEGDNSIGKSSFLLIVDFVFGGTTYAKSEDIIKNIGEHSIKFAFKFSNKMHYFCRSVNHLNEVYLCDENYNNIEKISLKEYCQWIGEQYDFLSPYTTFRKEIKYESNRKPVKIKYIKDIKKDLLRRDFTINTLCIDKDGNLLDILNIRSDLDNKLLKTVGNPRYRIKEDSLRILRCIRFATILDFDIEKKTKYFLTKYSYLLKSLSINRKKEELDKIFLSKNKERGRRLLLELNLTNALDLDKLATITMCTDLTGIWCQLEVDDIYPFTKVEKEQMSKLRELLKYDKIDNYLLYKYGLYLCTVYAEIKGIPRRKINTMYSKLPILTRRDINVTGEEISMILNKPPGKYIKDILDDIEVNILNSSIGNDKEEITKYIKDKYL